MSHERRFLKSAVALWAIASWQSVKELPSADVLLADAQRAVQMMNDDDEVAQREGVALKWRTSEAIRRVITNMADTPERNRLASTVGMLMRTGPKNRS